MSDFRKILIDIGLTKLSNDEIWKLQEALASKSKANTIYNEEKGKAPLLPPAEKELMDKCAQNRAEVFCCPHCGSVKVIKNGHFKNGRQKYFCNDCRKSFCDTYGTFLYRSKLSVETWKELLSMTVQNQSLTEISETLEINIATAWYNRHKICSAIQQNEGSQDTFPTIVEGDEFYTPLSFKGMQDKDFFISELGRMPNHHRTRAERYAYVESAGYSTDQINELVGLEKRQDELTAKEKEDGVPRSAHQLSVMLNQMDNKKAAEVLKGLDTVQKKKRGISNQQIAVLTGIDKLGNTYLAPTCIGRIEPKHIEEQWDGRFSTDSILVTDSLRAYRTFANNNNIHLRQIPSGKHSSGPFNLGTVNSYHSKLTAFMGIYREVSSKYLDHYLTLFRWQEKHRGTGTKAKVSELMDVLTQNARLLHSRKLKYKPLPFDTKRMLGQEFPYVLS